MTAVAQLADIPYDKLADIDYISVPGIYEPSPKQRTFHSLKVKSTGAVIDEMMFGGAAGFGKSLALLGDVLPYIFVAEELARRGDFPMGHCQAGALHLRRRSTGLKRSIRRSKLWFHQIFGNKAAYNESAMEWKFPSGFTLKFGHCKDPDSHTDYLTEEYVHFGADEGVELLKNQWDNICTRVRSDHPVFARMCKSRMATNPAPNWVRDYFVDPAPGGYKVLRRKLEMEDGTIEWKNRMFLPALLHDNPDKAFVRRYEKRLRGAPEHIRQAQLFGNWYFTADSYFGPHWRPDLHVIRPFAIPGDWPVFRAMDWGYKTHGVVLWAALDPDGNIIVFREFTFRYMDGEQVALRIKEIEQRMGYWKGRRSKLTGPADTNLWGDWSSADSHAERMARCGVSWVKADKKSRAMNGQRLIARLDDHRRGKTRPGIAFFDTCKMCIRTIPTIPIDENDSEAPEQWKPGKISEDHWADTAMMLCAYRSMSHDRFKASVARKQKEPLDAEEEFYEAEERKRRASDRGRLGYGSMY